MKKSVNKQGKKHGRDEKSSSKQQVKREPEQPLKKRKVDTIVNVQKQEASTTASSLLSPSTSTGGISPTKIISPENLVPIQLEKYSDLLNNATRLFHYIENPKINQSEDANMKDFSHKVSSVVINAKKELGYALHTEIILAGKVGIGKSTIINTLLGYEIAPSGNSPKSLTSAVVKYKYWEGPGFLVKLFKSKKHSSSSRVEESVENISLKSPEEVTQYLDRVFKKIVEKLEANGKEEEETDDEESQEGQDYESIGCVEVYSDSKTLASGLISLVDAPGYSFNQTANQFINSTYRANSVNNVEYWVIFEGNREQEDPTLWEFVKKVYNGMDILQTNSLCMVWHRFYQQLGSMIKAARKTNTKAVTDKSALMKQGKLSKLAEFNAFLQKDKDNVNIQLNIDDFVCSYVEEDAVNDRLDIYMQELKDRINRLAQRAVVIFNHLVDNLAQLIQPNVQNETTSMLSTEISKFYLNDNDKKALKGMFGDTDVSHRIRFANDSNFLRLAINHGGIYQNAKKRLDLHQELEEIMGNISQKTMEARLQLLNQCIDKAATGHLKSGLTNIVNIKTRAMSEGLRDLVHNLFSPKELMNCTKDSSGKRIVRVKGYSDLIFQNFSALVKKQGLLSQVQDRAMKIFNELITELQNQLLSYSKSLNIVALQNIPEFRSFSELLKSAKSHTFKHIPKSFPKNLNKLEWQNGGRCFVEAILYCLDEPKREKAYKMIIEYCDKRVRHFQNQKEKSIRGAHLFEIILMFDCYVFPTEIMLNKLCKKLDIKLEIIGDLLSADNPYKYYGNKENPTVVRLAYDDVRSRFFPVAKDFHFTLPNADKFSLSVHYNPQ